MKILIAEDDPDSRRLLRKTLIWGGHEVAEAANGEEAWSLWQAGQYRMVITDWMMPDLSGPDLARRIRGAGASFYTYIIILTALGAKPQVVMGLEAGTDDYLTKPFYPEELLERVATGERIVKLEERLSESRRQAEFLANHDTLTGLFNRRAIQDQSKVEIVRSSRTNTPLSLILLDLDHFKQINDRYGHSTGDLALQKAAAVLSDSIRVYDAVGRWGGEEFLVVLPGATPEAALAVAERIRAGVSEVDLKSAAGERVELRVSLGVASTCGGVAEDAGQDDAFLLESLLQFADDALYQAKAGGRDRACLGKCV